MKGKDNSIILNQEATKVEEAKLEDSKQEENPKDDEESMKNNVFDNEGKGGSIEQSDEVKTEEFKGEKT